MMKKRRRAPAIMPGKKPRRTALAGYSDGWDTEALAALEVWAEELGFVVDDGEEEDLAVVDAEEDFEVAAADGFDVDDEGFALEEDEEPITQLPFWHEKPFGQQLLPPHCWSDPDRSVLCSWLEGVRVAFCFD